MTATHEPASMLASRPDSPTTWTTVRRQRQRLLKHCGGDAKKARPIWWKYTHELFAKWLHDNDVLDEWRVGDD